MDDGPDLAAIVEMFHLFASSAAARAPLYGRLSAGIADDAAVAAMLLDAPPTQRQPVLLFACVHDLLLADPDHELALHYPNLTEHPATGDPVPVFARFCVEHADELRQLLAARSTQTNEIGRCALLVPPLGIIADEVGEIAMLDVGASAGLNLLLDRYAYRYEPGGDVGGPSPVVLPCGTRGPVPVPAALPPVVTAIGLDRSPVDVSDEGATRWLEACVWPDQKDRFHRLRKALGIARSSRAIVHQGDAVEDAAALAGRLAGTGHPVVTNTWVLNYLTSEQRVAYVDSLETLGRTTDLSWIYAESPQLTPELPGPGDDQGVDRTALMMVRWRDGRQRVDHLATVHAHGYWIHWRPP